MNSNNVKIERPDLFMPSFTHPFANRIAGHFINAGVKTTKIDYQPNMAILVRTKNDELGLRRILDNLTKLRGYYNGRIDIVVVDTESRDRTISIAKESGASVVKLLQTDFTYPKSLNIGLSVVESDIEATYLTVGHAQPVLSNTYSAAAAHFRDKSVVGVYGRAIPHESASFTEKLFARGLIEGHRTVKHVDVGVFGATNAMIRMRSWREHPFDETYEAGGEDGAWAAAALERGEIIVFEPATSVHHSHGLNFVNSVKQWRHWKKTCAGPAKLNRDELAARRPDLRQ